LKILPRAFVLSLCRSFLISAVACFLLKILCEKFATNLLPFVFLISVLICVTLCYLSAVHYKVFRAQLMDQKLMITKGFIIKRKKHINLRFIVSVKYVSTPVMRLLGLSSILVLSEGSGCFLPLITAKDAEFLYQSILSISENNEKI